MCVSDRLHLGRVRSTPAESWVWSDPSQSHLQSTWLAQPWGCSGRGHCRRPERRWLGLHSELRSAWESRSEQEWGNLQSSGPAAKYMVGWQLARSSRQCQLPKELDLDSS